MLKRNRARLWAAAAAALLILAAMVCRRVGSSGYQRMVMGLIRSAIYLGLAAAWGISVRRRVMQAQARRYLSAGAAAMVFWIAIRTVKYFFVHGAAAARLLWYLYYLPLLFIPLFAVFAAFSLGQPEDFRPKGWTALLYLPAAALLLLVLTNDLHQFVFFFPPDAAEPTDHAYGYAAGYWLVIGWIGLCGVTALAVMLARCRVPRSRTVLWLPTVPMLLAALYAAATVFRVQAVRFIMGDVTVSLCLFFAAFFECCIQCGLIQSNTCYGALFRASTLCAQITDRRYAASYVSDALPDISPALMRQAGQAPVMLNENSRLFSAAIRNGHVLWIEDMTEEGRLLRELQETGRQLEGENALLLAENQLKEKKARIDAQNRLYDRITGEIEPQLNKLTALIESARADAGSAPGLLAQIGVLGAYIKRRSNLVLLSEDAAEMPAAELAYCLRESADNLESAGTACACWTDCAGSMDTGTALRLYDFFEAVIEAALPSLRSLLIRLTANGRRTALRLMLSCACPPETVTALPGCRALTEAGVFFKVTGGSGELCVDAVSAKEDDAP